MTAKVTTEAFWKKAVFNQANNCLEWNESKNRQGYGRIKINGKSLRAHRYSYELTYGDIPDGMDVLHKCDNPACINPKHLFLGNDKDNVSDAIAKGRHINPKTIYKLTADQIREIKNKYIPNIYSIRKLAREYKVSYWAIQSILHGVNWKNVRT
jgi:hypothetical protein